MSVMFYWNKNSNQSFASPEALCIKYFCQCFLFLYNFNQDTSKVPINYIISIFPFRWFSLAKLKNVANQPNKAFLLLQHLFFTLQKKLDLHSEMTKMISHLIMFFGWKDCWVFSVAGFEMILQRHVSHYLITYYLPSGTVYSTLVCTVVKLSNAVSDVAYRIAWFVYLWCCLDGLCTIAIEYSFVIYCS